MQVEEVIVEDMVQVAVPSGGHWGRGGHHSGSTTRLVIGAPDKSNTSHAGSPFPGLLPGQSISPSLSFYFRKRGSYPGPLPFLGLPWAAQERAVAFGAVGKDPECQEGC